MIEKLIRTQTEITAKNEIKFLKTSHPEIQSTEEQRRNEMSSLNLHNCAALFIMLKQMIRTK